MILADEIGPTARNHVKNEPPLNQSHVRDSAWLRVWLHVSYSRIQYALPKEKEVFSHASPEPEVHSPQTAEMAARSLLLTAVIAGRMLLEHCRTLGHRRTLAHQDHWKKAGMNQAVGAADSDG